MLLLDGIKISDYGICLADRLDIPTAERDAESISVRGRNGSLTKKYGWLDKTVKVPFNFLDDESDFLSIFRQFKILLMEAKELSNTDDPGFYNKIKTVSVADAKNTIIEYGEFEADLTLDPFDYEYDNTVIPITSETTIFNPGWESQPYIKVYGSGDGTLYVNSSAVNFTGIDGFIELDCDMLLAYKTINGILTPQDIHMAGTFPVLDHGDNSIAFSGGITKVEMIVRKRWI